jgi:hypothetical protein
LSSFVAFIAIVAVRKSAADKRPRPFSPPWVPKAGVARRLREGGGGEWGCISGDVVALVVVASVGVADDAMHFMLLTCPS